MSDRQDDDVYRRVFALHPELLEWNEKDYDRAELEEGVNWRLHIEFDAVVLRRMADPGLPDAGVIRELRARGSSELDAIHRVADQIARHIWALSWLGDVQDGRKRPEELPEELRGRGMPTNEELNGRIRALLAPSGSRGHRRRSGKRR